MLIEYSNRQLFIGILIMVFPAIPGILLTVLFIVRNEQTSTILIAILIIFMGLPVGLILLIQSLKGKKLKKQRNLPSATSSYSCIFCGHEYDKRIYGGPTNCLKCGKESPFCDICYDYIFFGKPVYLLQDCGHIFHKTELLDHLENNDICPKCKQKISSIDLMLDLQKTTVR
jgi:DNA-directed RNA polymerase subunit RPC12/RpoP